MEKVYNKLVRDKIPEIIYKDHKTCTTRILDECEYKEALERKLLEEYQEVLCSKENQRIEELGDMLEVMVALSKLEGKTLQDIIEAMNKKRDKNGGFEKRIFLEKVIEK